MTRYRLKTNGGERDLVTAFDVRLISYEFPLRPDLTVNLWFPEDLTEADAERVAAFVRALAMKKPGSSRPVS